MLRISPDCLLEILLPTPPMCVQNTYIKDNFLASAIYTSIVHQKLCKSNRVQFQLSSTSKLIGRSIIFPIKEAKFTNRFLLANLYQYSGDFD